VFTATAGAHQAYARLENKRALSPDEEERLVFAPLKLYLRRCDELEPADRKAVELELAVCLVTTAQAIMAATYRYIDRLAVEWKRLDRAPAPDYAAGVALRAEKRRLVTELDRYLNRCTKYLTWHGRLPVPDAAVERWTELAAAVQECSTMSTRLRRHLA
jgi:hypothetical protein